MKKIVLLAGAVSILTLSGCEWGHVSKKTVSPAILAEQPDYFIRPADVEAASGHCEGEIEGFAVTNKTVPVLHFVCSDGTSYRMDLGTGKVFKRTVL